MKGNHNMNYVAVLNKRIVFNKSKIQNERKSQLFCLRIVHRNYCVQQVKDTK